MAMLLRIILISACTIFQTGLGWPFQERRGFQRQYLPQLFDGGRGRFKHHPYFPQQFEERPERYEDGRRKVVELQSWGLDDDEDQQHGYIRVGGQPYFRSSRHWRNRHRGINLLPVNPDTFQVGNLMNFDTHAGYSDELANYIRGVPQRTILLGVTADAATTRIAAALEVLREAGIVVDDVGYRGKFAFVAQKGYPANTVIIKAECGGRAVKVTTIIEDCSSSCKITIPPLPPPPPTTPPPPSTTPLTLPPTSAPTPAPATHTTPEPTATTPEPTTEPTTTTPPPTTTPIPPINFTLVIDDKIKEVYADGVQITGDVAFRYVDVGFFVMPSTTSQISIRGQNIPGICAVVGSDSTGKFMTNKTWRCSNKEVDGWSAPAFDDSKWESAKAEDQTEPAYSGWLPKTIGPLTINAKAKVIWTSDCHENEPIFCRSPRL